jgi:hypothetical protein
LYVFTEAKYTALRFRPPTIIAAVCEPQPVVLFVGVPVAVAVDQAVPLNDSHDDAVEPVLADDPSVPSIASAADCVPAPPAEFRQTLRFPEEDQVPTKFPTAFVRPRNIPIRIVPEPLTAVPSVPDVA